MSIMTNIVRTQDTEHTQFNKKEEIFAYYYSRFAAIKSHAKLRLMALVRDIIQINSC